MSVIKTNDGRSFTLVKENLGAGGQGSVVQVLVNNKPKALKLLNNCPEELKSNIKRLVASGNPCEDLFVWPEECFELQDGTFAYLMKLFPKGYIEYNKHMMRAVYNGDYSLLPSVRSLCRLSNELCTAMDILHRRGLVYVDISVNNIAFNPKTGRIVIFDNDNVVPQGSFACGAIGTYGSMAPEVILGATPTIESDNHSLAAVLFQFWTLHSSPYDGKCAVNCIEGPEYYQEYHGNHPHFAFDTEDKKLNLPDKSQYRAVWDRWRLLSPDIQKAFLTSLARGAKDPKKRLNEHKWAQVFAKALGSIVLCSHCRAENFVVEDGKPKFKCWQCGKKYPKAYLSTAKSTFGSNKIALFKQQKIDNLMLDPYNGNRKRNKFHVVAEVVYDKGIAYLVNRSTESWRVRLPDGSEAEVAPNVGNSIVAGSSFKIGSVELFI